jgi:ATP-dependent RNA helicase DHX57
MDPVLTIVAFLSGKSPFVSPLDKREEAFAQHCKFFSNQSDHLTVCKVFGEWELLSKSEKREFCRENYLSYDSLKAMADFRSQLKRLMTDLGYINNDSNYNLHSENPNLIKAVLLAGLYPNIASIQMPESQYEETSGGTVKITPKSSEIHFYTKADGRVFLHPSSMLFKEQSYKSHVLIFGSKFATSKNFMKECSSCSDLALLLFGGNLEVIHDGNTLVLDNIRFRAFPRISGKICLIQFW